MSQKDEKSRTQVVERWISSRKSTTNLKKWEIGHASNGEMNLKLNMMSDLNKKKVILAKKW
jgi:hypothetical protein